MKKKAFTLIEILIVLFIFWVGILAVLTVLTYSLGYFDQISTKTKASFLAREWLEIAYNFRDSQIEQWYPWNYFDWDHNQEVYLWTEGYTNFEVGFKSWENIWTSIRDTYITFNTTEPEDDFTENFKKYHLGLFTWRADFWVSNQKEYSYYQYEPIEGEELPINWFARIVSLTPIKIKAWDLNPKRLLKITSRVLYKRNTQTWEVILESFIGMSDSLPADN
jgi:type II secretory pathway pseudopilin PulG